MTVPPNSRYVNGTLTRMPDAVGVYSLTVLRTVSPQAQHFRYYTWQLGDRPDSVAYAAFGNSSLWWAIFDINPEIIDPMNVPVGAIVRIPTDPITSQGTLLQ
jgi:hypothetical protein